MSFADADSERAGSLAAEVGGTAVQTNAGLAAAVDLVILAVKPPALEAVAAETAGNAPAVLSLLGATRIDRLEAAFPAAPVARVIPNQPVEVRSGVLCFCPGPAVSDELSSSLSDVLGALGSVVTLEEEMLDVATAVMSCTPAYFADIAGVLVAAGEAHGLEPPVARRLVAETLAGTGALLAARDPDAVRGAVATPGGITERGLEVPSAAGVPEALRSAVDTTMERMRG